jgi:hypothetical protein
MKLKSGCTYKRRDGKGNITVKKDISNGTNYIFKSIDDDGIYSWYLESGHFLGRNIEHEEDLIEEII